MITGFLTFVLFFAIVGCVLYGRKLIKTEKVDAVFGNPERAQGGLHWVIVGSSFLLLVWLYYSWDMAKSFFPKSANELCQVGKIDESLLSLKYLFPIEERQLKSTSVIETETKNLNKIILLIEKSNDVENENKNKLLDFVDQTKKTIPLLTNENLLENETKEIEVISLFLPKQLSEDETKKICEEAIKSSGASSMKDMGKVMGILKSKHADSLDFSKVSLIIKEILN